MPSRLAKPAFVMTFWALGALAFSPGPAAAQETARRGQPPQQARTAVGSNEAAVREFVREHWMISIRLARLLGFVNIPDPAEYEPPMRGWVIDGPDPIGNSGDESSEGGDRGDSGSTDEGTGGTGNLGLGGSDGDGAGGSGEGE